MNKIIDYYLSPMSPWTYLGHARFQAIAKKHGASIQVKPVDVGRIFPVSGGLPVSKRPPQRQAYRLVELTRWSGFLGVPLNLHPKFFPYDAQLATHVILAADSSDAAMRLTGAMLSGCWKDEKNMADEKEIERAIRQCGTDPGALLSRARSPEIAARYEALNEEAIARQVFGVPTYVYRDELFWGQDRLEFLDRALGG